MGNIIKINIYIEMIQKSFNLTNLETIEKNISEYKSWIKNINREDIIENYEEFLQKQYLYLKDNKQ